MTPTWNEDALHHVERAQELVITPERADGTPRREVPIWVVTAGGQVYVRTWHRRRTGWFGHILDTRRARIRVPGLDAEVTVEDLGAQPAALRAEIDAAYRAKYGALGGAVARMVGEDAAATTLRLDPRSSS